MSMEILVSNGIAIGWYNSVSDALFFMLVCVTRSRHNCKFSNPFPVGDQQKGFYKSVKPKPKINHGHEKQSCP